MKKRALILISLIALVSCQYVARHGKTPTQGPNLLKAAKEALKKGDCAEASELLQRELKENGKSFQALFWLGISEAMCGRYGRAYRYLQSSLGYAPSQKWTGRVYAATGFVFHLLNKEKEAAVYFKLAKETRYPTKLWELFNKGGLNRASGYKVILSWM